MPKTKLSDILKNGEKLEVRKLDPNDPDFIKMCDAVQKEQERVKKMKQIDWRILNKVINI